MRTTATRISAATLGLAGAMLAALLMVGLAHGPVSPANDGAVYTLTSYTTSTDRVATLTSTARHVESRIGAVRHRVHRTQGRIRVVRHHIRFARAHHVRVRLHHRVRHFHAEIRRLHRRISTLRSRHAALVRRITALRRAERQRRERRLNAPCPTHSPCVVNGDYGVTDAFNAERTSLGLSTVTPGTTVNAAQACAVEGGTGPDCQDGQLCVSATALDAQQAMADFEANATDFQTMQDPNMSTISVGWAYHPEWSTPGYLLVIQYTDGSTGGWS